MRRRMAFACTVLAMATVISGISAQAANGGFKTSRPSMLTPVMSGVQATPLLTVGDVLPSGYRFEAIPDGISVRPRSPGRVDLFVNHETSKVPFPFNTATPMAGNGESDFDNAQVSRLIVNPLTGGVLNGSFVIPSSEGFQRFCSNYLATSKEGFDRDIFFTNEESPDFTFRQEDSWPPPIGDPDEKENGVVVALDPQTGKYHTVFGMGRHNHENDVAIPGFDDLVVMSGDDTFTSGPLTGPPNGFSASFPGDEPDAFSQSQLYSYIAPDTDSILADEGDLWAFVSDDLTHDDYYDFGPGSTAAVSGQFIEVPKDIATGHDTDGSELKAPDNGFPFPPISPNWQTDLRTTGASTAGVNGPQWMLEYWSQTNNVFDFVRVEDIAYDKRPGHENVVYIIDSGRGRRSTDTPLLDTPFRSTNGRIWKMVLDPEDPTVVDSLSIFLDGDDSELQTFNEIHQPDNIESTQTGLLVTEDPGGSNQFNPGETGATSARLWYVPFAGENAGTPAIVAKVDQSADEGPTDFDGAGRLGRLGAWEFSGIVDASAAFGPGWFLIDVQAHTLWVEQAPGKDTLLDANSDPDFTYKREGGQLLLIRIPGI
jgi:hypothetical protein